MAPLTFPLNRTQVNDFARDQADVDAQLERVKAKIAEMTAEKEEHQRAIQEAQRIRDGAGFTSTEQVANLQGNPFVSSL